MTTLGRHLCTRVLAVLCLASVCAAQERAATHTWGIELNGQLCGYSDATVSTVRDDADDAGGEYTLIEQTTIFSASVLGLAVDRQVDITYHVDPATGQYTSYALHVTSGDLDLRSEVVVDGDTAMCTSLLSDDSRPVTLPPGVLLANSLYLPHARRDLAELGAAHQDYLVLDPDNLDVPIQTVTYTKVGTDVLDLAGKAWDVVVVDTLNKTSGVKARLWLDTADALVVKVRMANGMEIALADPSVRDRIERVDADSLILARAATGITDVSAIASMTVKASMEPSGAWLDAADLNVPGQRFEGEVHENRIEGVFEIEHARYDGAHAPPYPPGLDADESLARYLAPGALIESDDPALVEKATEIAAGSTDSWDAAGRLSAWVADNIDYEIPGGIFARKVYDMRVGECGGHSVLLAAFCRAVGIPARAVWGCMYTPMGGGSFGQHAWTEIYMGDAGWIPVDSTAHETDFVDSGHIRLGTFGSAEDGTPVAIALGARTMEVLDYRLTGEAHEGAATAAGRYVAYVGDYEVPGYDQPFRVLVKNGALGIDIPGKMVLPMKDPDENGNWTCALSNLVYCTFTRDPSGNVTGMVFHEIVRMRRRSDPHAVADDVPDDLRRCLGGYFFPQANAEYSITWDDGRLGLYDPLSGDTRDLARIGEDGHWTIEDGKKEITFVLDDDGSVISMSIDVGSEFPRVVGSVASTD